MYNGKLNIVIESFQQLPLDEREYALDILNKQLIEFRRSGIARRAKEAKSNLKKGRVKRGTAQELLEDLNND